MKNILSTVLDPFCKHEFTTRQLFKFSGFVVLFFLKMDFRLSHHPKSVQFFCFFNTSVGDFNARCLANDP